MRDDADAIGAWASRYLSARDAEADARREKAAAAAYLRGNTGLFPAPGGGMVQVGLSSPSLRAPEPDPAAMVEVLTAAGLPVPTRTPAPASAALQVRRA